MRGLQLYRVLCTLWKPAETGYQAENDRRFYPLPGMKSKRGPMTCVIFIGPSVPNDQLLNSHYLPYTCLI